MTLIKYLLVGVLNTIVGFGLIFLLMWRGFSPEISNIIGYAVGICFSFVMNKIFTFQSKQASKKANLAEFAKFVSSMLIAWSLNFITLKICLKFGRKSLYFANHRRCDLHYHGIFAKQNLGF